MFDKGKICASSTAMSALNFRQQHAGLPHDHIYGDKICAPCPWTLPLWGIVRTSFWIRCSRILIVSRRTRTMVGMPLCDSRPEVWPAKPTDRVTIRHGFLSPSHPHTLHGLLRLTS